MDSQELRDFSACSGIDVEEDVQEFNPNLPQVVEQDLEAAEKSANANLDALEAQKMAHLMWIHLEEDRVKLSVCHTDKVKSVLWTDAWFKLVSLRKEGEATLSLDSGKFCLTLLLVD